MKYEEIGLPRTRSVSAAGLGMQFLGLAGYSWLAVFGGGLLVLIMADSFLAGLGTTVVMYWFVRRFIEHKPRYWLIHTVAYALNLPRHFRHRPGYSAAKTSDHSSNLESA